MLYVVVLCLLLSLALIIALAVVSSRDSASGGEMSVLIIYTARHSINVRCLS